MANYNQNRGHKVSKHTSRSNESVEVVSNYNFVPAPKEGEVYIPDWADKISHDIPFEDGESGELEVSIEAKTPIFIRNGYAQGKESSEFSHIEVNGEKKYFIPATSIKGMLRSAVEIISSSRMIQVQNAKHSVRQIMKTKSDFSDEHYELGKDKKNIYCGFLIKTGNNYYLLDCDKPYKIRYTDIDSEYNTSFYKQFKKGGLADLSDFSNKSAKFKYNNLLKNKQLERKFKIHPLNEDKQKSWVSKFQPLKYLLFESQGDKDGTVVCTGQATDYDSNQTARKGEYVFEGRRSETIKLLNSSKNKFIEVNSDVIESFLMVCKNNTSQELEDWTYWKKEIYNGIPVFFRKTNDGKAIKDLGLTFMYKQPVKHSVYDLLPYDMDNKSSLKLDLAECIFGTTRTDKSLKGRVFISNAFIDHIEGFEEKMTIGLSSPHSSYYPFYLQQNTKNGRVKNAFNTYNTESSKLKGFKKYIMTSKLRESSVENEKMKSPIQAISPKSSFKFKIKFHNLKKVEIGALLSALTFHNSSEDYYFSIGQGKPLGFGTIKLELKNEQTFGLKNDYEHYLKAFELEMLTIDKNWNKSDRIKEYLTLSKIHDDSKSIQYPAIDEFIEYKNKGLALQYLSSKNKSDVYFKQFSNEKEVETIMKREGVKKEIKTLEKDGDIEAIDNFIHSHGSDFDVSKLLMRRKQLEKEQRYNDLLKTDNSQEIKDFISQYPEFEGDTKLQSLNNELEKQEKFEDLLNSDDINDIEEFVSKNEFYPGIDRLRSRIKELQPDTIPARLAAKPPILNLNQFIKEASNWKRKEPSAFIKHKIELKEIFDKNGYESDREYKRNLKKINNLFS